MSATFGAYSLSLGSPPGKTILNVIGTAHLGDFVYVFAQGSDRAIWCMFYLNGAWQPWVSLGAPPGGLAVTDGPRNNVVAAGNSIWVYALGNDGKVWCNLWSGAAWTWVAAPGAPVGTTITSMLGVNIKAAMVLFGKGADGSVWAATWNGFGWNWGKSTDPHFPTIAWLGWDHTSYTPNVMNILQGAAIIAITRGEQGAQGVKLAMTQDKKYGTISITFELATGGTVLCKVTGSEETTQPDPWA